MSIWGDTFSYLEEFVHPKMHSYSILSTLKVVFTKNSILFCKVGLANRLWCPIVDTYLSLCEYLYMNI